MQRIFISTSSFADASREPLDLLEREKIEYRLNPLGRRLTSTEVLDLFGECDGVIAGTEPLDRRTLEQLPALKIISRCGTGLENVDLDAAADLGIEVCRTPDALTHAVAELALAGMLDVLRSVSLADRTLRSGAWQKPMGRLLRGKTVGIIGLGRIGKALVELLQPFEVEIIAYDIAPDRVFAEQANVGIQALDDLVASADIVSLHLPLSAETQSLIDAKRLRSMRRGAILINCSRGGLVDEDALCEQLELGKIGGAYLDTFEHEPYVGPLTGFTNVLLTPHIGSYAAESRALMELEAARNIARFFREESIG